MCVSTFIAKQNEKYQKKKIVNTLDNTGIQNKWIAAGIKIADFQTPDEMSGTTKYLLYIFKIHWKLCIMATFDVHKYSFCEIFFYFFFIPCKNFN